MWLKIIKQICFPIKYIWSREFCSLLVLTSKFGWKEIPSLFPLKAWNVAQSHMRFVPSHWICQKLSHLRNHRKSSHHRKKHCISVNEHACGKMSCWYNKKHGNACNWSSPLVDRMQPTQNISQTKNNNFFWFVCFCNGVLDGHVVHCWLQ